jgi:hypothetical protein
VIVELVPLAVPIVADLAIAVPPQPIVIAYVELDVNVTQPCNNPPAPPPPDKP